MPKVAVDLSNRGVMTARVLKENYKGKHIPKIEMHFTNGIPQDYDTSKGFDTELEGTYDAVLALIDQMREAIVMFREEENKAKV